MVAIGVMAILAGILFTGFNQNRNAPGLDTAQLVLSQAFYNARSQAILKQNRARLIIQSQEPGNAGESEKFLRYFGVIVETGPDSNQWETTLKGAYLPEGVFFIPESPGESISWNENLPTSRYNGQSMNLVFPSQQLESPGTGPEWHFYEFKSTGRMSGLTNKVVLAQGDTQNLTPSFPEPTPILGMVFTGYGLQFPLDEEDAL